MGGKGGGTNTVTQNSGPPQQFLDAYQNVQGQAQNVASTPYQAYPGQTVAQFSPDQIAAMGQVENLTANGGIQAPYLQQAQNYFTQATQPLLTPELQQQINQNSGQALAPATSAAVSGIQGATGTATSGIGSAANSGMQGIQSATGAGTSGIMGAAGAGSQGILSAAHGLNPGALQQWEDPYTQQVVNATQAQFNNQNQQQQAQVTGNAISQGAFGGDREAVAQALTAEQQQLAQAPVIANLENQGYQTALGAAQQQAALQTQAATSAGSLGLQGATSAGSLGLQGASTAGSLGLQGASTAGSLGLQGAQAAGQAGLQGATTGSQLGLQGAQMGLGANQANAWLNSQAGFGNASLGSEAQQLGLQGASSLLSTGGLQQQMAQENLNIPYEQYLASQAYPFQTTGWLANIAEGLGGASGGNSSTTSPAASSASQIAGLGIGATGLGLSAYNNGLFSGGGNGAGGYTDAAANAAAAAAASNYSGMSSAAYNAAANSGLGPLYNRGGMLPHRASGGAGLSDYGLSGSPIDNDVSGLTQGVIGAGSPVPGASGMGAAPGSHGTPAILKNYGSTSTTTGGGGGDSLFGSLLKGAGQIAAGVYGGPAGSLAAGALGSQVHFNSGGMTPHREGGGPTGERTSDETKPTPIADSEPWYAPLVQEHLASQMAASLVPPADASGAGMKSGGMLPLMPAKHLAGGGMTSPWWEKSEARNATERHGLLTSPIAGRTDKLAVSPAAGSYVIPADVISGLGEGNTLAGANVMQRILDTGPHGIPMTQMRAARSMPHPPPMYHEGEGDDGLASGGGIGHFASGGMSDASNAYLAGNGLGGFGLPSGNGTYSPVPSTGINASTGQGASQTGLPALDNYLNSTEAGARFNVPFGGAQHAAAPAQAAPSLTPQQQAILTAAAAQQEQQANNPPLDISVIGAGQQKSGGRVQRRDDGGPIYDEGGWDDGSAPSGMGPQMSLGFTPATMSGEPPPPSLPGASEPAMGMKPAPRQRHAPLRPQSDIDAGGMQQSGPPAPPPPAGASSAPAAQPRQGSDYDKYLSKLKPTQPDPWLDLALAGFAMAGGKSPHALENIGSGAAKGLAAYIGQKQQAGKEELQAGETAARLADTAAYREGVLGNTANRNATYADRVAAINITQQRALELKAAGLDEATAHHQAQEEAANGLLDARIDRWKTQADQAGQRLAQGDARLAQGDRRLNQGDQNIALRTQSIQNTQEYRAAQQQLAQSHLTQSDQQQLLARAVSLAAGTMIPFSKAYDQVSKQLGVLRGGSAAPAAGNVAPAAPPGQSGGFQFPP